MHNSLPNGNISAKLEAPSRSIALSVLDQSPIRAGHSPTEAIAETVELAQAAERFGYRRYWLAEHHSSEAFAGTAPEILLAHLAAVTSTMRIGSGGVMLNHYSPLKVAEVFKVLHALHPGRIDMGIGRAASEDGPTTYALRQRSRPVGRKKFSDQVADLLAFLGDRVPWTHRHLDVRAQPKGQTTPEPWLLGSTHHGATLAAHFGCAFSFAHFINADRGVAAMRHYRRNFRPSPWLTTPKATVCVFALCADTEQEAHRLALSRDSWVLQASRVTPGPLPSVETAETLVYTEQDRLLVAADQRNRIVGTPEQVRDRLRELAAQYWVDEILVLTVCFDPAARRRSYGLLAEAFDLQNRTETPVCRSSTPAWTRPNALKAALRDLPRAGVVRTVKRPTAPDPGGAWI